MACTLITAGIARGCKDNVGGIKTVWLLPKVQIASIASVAGSGVITAITTTGTTPVPKFKRFEMNKNSSNWVENIQSNVQNGSVGYEQVLTMIFSKNEATKRNVIKLLGTNELVALVLDLNGTYWYLGETAGLDVTAGSSASGTAMADLNGWTITLGSNEPEPAKTYTGATTILDLT